MTKKNEKKDLDHILELKNITKTFLGGKIVANDDVSISFARNEVHAIVGENGSGKSTLMNIIFGLYKQDKGDIFLNGKKVNMYESGAAKKFRIGMVHQHFHLVDNFTVLENVILGQEQLSKSKEAKKHIKDLKNELVSITKELKTLKKEEPEFSAKVEKLISLKLKAIYEIEKEKNIIQGLKVEKAKVSETKKSKKFNKIIEQMEIRQEIIEKEQQVLNLISEAETMGENEAQERIVELSERELIVRRELRINDVKLTGAFGKIKKKDALKRLKIIEEKYNIQLDPYAKIESLAVGQRQMVEILKVLWEDKEIIVFDEPTATLSVVEIEALMETIKALKEEGKTIIFISHKLKEVKEIGDRVSVLKKGEFMGTYKNDAKLKPADIGKLMVGKTIDLKYPARKIANNPILKVENLSYRTHSGFLALDDVSFEVNEGEIFGIAGIEGNGQEEIVKILTNLRKPYKGKVTYKDKVLTDRKGYKLNGKKRREIMSHVPIDRLKHGVVPVKDLQFNAKITDFDTSKFSSTTKDERELIREENNSRYAQLELDYLRKVEILEKEISILDKLNNETKDKNVKKELKRLLMEIEDKIKVIKVRIKNIDNDKSFNLEKLLKPVYRFTNQIIEGMNVDGAFNQQVELRNLSGGNQQKFVVGREVYRKHEILVAGHPTRGLDISAIDHIYKEMIKNSEGKATLLYSLEINELLAVCDRVAVMYHGKIMNIIDPRKTSLEKVSRMMIGEVE